ncbi:hypothetical protein Tsubulata_022005 [Turnera subulata]|uniref:DUF4283 domain-containing protein n=1 Tax=Turnera subulata TaxID=218843 RepID=A0A9Q0FZ72_9ROSI|nr:hypothetical protein Tsubulata_022005 [Turnera subulata]
MANLELALKVTKPEDEGAIDGTSLTISQISKKVLLGRIVSDRFFGPGFVKSSMAKLWKCEEDFEVQGKGFNHYVFQFASEDDKRRVANGAPWFVANQHNVVKEWLPNMS